MVALLWLLVPEEMEGVSRQLQLPRELCQGWEGAPSLGAVRGGPFRALHLSCFSSRCWARAGGAACRGASSASPSPAVSSSLSLCHPSSQLSLWVSAPGQG